MKITRYTASILSIPERAFNVECIYPEHETQLGRNSFGFRYEVYKKDDKQEITTFEKIMKMTDISYYPETYSVMELERIYGEKFVEDMDKFVEDNNKKEDIEFKNQMKRYMKETENLGRYDEKDYEQDDWLEEQIEIFEMKRNMPLNELLGEVDMYDESNVISDGSDYE
jgi:hypothetical protein